MLTNKQVRMLELLDDRVSKCNRCELNTNGNVLPYWTRDSKYVMINESPSKREVTIKRPFRGSSGDLLKQILTNAGLKSKDFLIINSVQCVPNFHHGGHKPTLDQLDVCNNHVRKYVKIINPEKIICLGNYAKYLFTGETQGVLRQRGVFSEWDIGGGYIFPVIFTIHPAYCIYAPAEGVKMLRDDVLKFRDTKFERKVDWLFKEEEFLL